MRLFFLFIFLSLSLVAEKIDSYIVNIKVKDSGSLIVKEKIIYDFEDRLRHGIYRDIPIKKRIKGSFIPVDIGISDINVLMDSKKVKFSSDLLNGGDVLRIKIGDPNRVISKKHSFEISYKILKSIFKEKDRAYLRVNIIGFYWKVPIKRVEAKIVFPSFLDYSKVNIKLYSGKYRSTFSNFTTKWLDKRTLFIKGGPLAPKEGVTLEASFSSSLLDDRFKEAVVEVPFANKLLENLPIFLIFAFIAYLYKLGSNWGVWQNIGSIVVSYYPPKGLSLLESALLIDKFADSKDLAPAILELGAKGYLKIRKEDRDIIIEKIKDVDNQLTFDQKKIMNELLFKDSNSYTISPYNNRGREIYYFAKNINNELYEWAKREGYIFDNLKESRRDFLKRALLAFGVVLLIDLFVIFKLFGVEALFLSIFGAIFIGIGLVVIISSIIKKEIFGIIFGIIWLSISASIFFSEDSYLFNLKGFFLSPIFIVPLLGGFIYFIYHKVGRYTQKGIRVVRKLYGLERFIKRVEQDKIKRFLKSDPNYLDKLLPYAVMFGLNEHWFRVYEEFNKEPSFFLAPIYEVDFFNREFMNAASIGESSLSTPSSIDSISMGGSFGGGGVGGGGGGSW